MLDILHWRSMYSGHDLWGFLNKRSRDTIARTLLLVGISAFLSSMSDTPRLHFAAILCWCAVVAVVFAVGLVISHGTWLAR
jgi:hypothetical protein